MVDLEKATIAGELDMKLHWFSRAAGFGLDNKLISGNGHD